jgi:hypothetical protein
MPKQNQDDSEEQAAKTNDVKDPAQALEPWAPGSANAANTEKKERSP